MHIIEVITELEPAGAEKILSELSVELKKRGLDVSVVSLKGLPKNRAILDKLKDNGIDVFFLNLRKESPWKIFSLKKLLNEIIDKNHSPNTIIHSHLMHPNLICRISKLMGLKAKLVNTIHVAERRKNQSSLFLLDKLTLRYCDVLTAVSSSASSYHAKMLNINRDHIRVINNGITLPNKPKVEEIIDLKKEWRVLGCSRIIGSVGRLDFQKGYDLFFDLLPELSQKIPKGERWAIVILGEGKERKFLEEKAKNLPENIKVALPGFRKDAAVSIGAFDLFVMPSRYEGFGLVLLEAISHGTAILASNVDSIPQIISNYPNGRCLDFENKQIAIEQIIKYSDKPKIVDYKTEYTQEKMVSEYLCLYKELIDQRKKKIKDEIYSRPLLRL